MIRVKLILTSFVLAGAWCTAACGAEPPAPQEISGKIDWVYDYEDGRRASRESGRPLFVVFRCER